MTPIEKIIKYLEERTEDWQTEIVLVDALNYIKSKLPAEREAIEKAHLAGQNAIQAGIDYEDGTITKVVNQSAQQYFNETFKK